MFDIVLPYDVQVQVLSRYIIHHEQRLARKA